MQSRLPLVLSAGNFVVGLGAFVVIGLISPIATTFSTTPDVAGRVLTWYAIAYAIGSPLVTALSGTIPRRLVLTIGMTVFAVGAAMGALAPTLLLLELSRVLVAIGAGLFTPGAAAVAVASSLPEKRAQSLSVVFAGLTIAQAAGVPIGAWAGYAFGYPVTFAIVAALGALAAVLVWFATPSQLPFQPTSLAALGRTLATPKLMFAILFTATMMAAVFTLYTYLGPLIEQRYGFGRDGVSLYLLLFGIAAIFGNFLGGWSSDRIGPSRTLLAIAIGQAIFIPLLAGVAMPAVVMAVAVFTWSLIGWSYMTPQQSRLVSIGPDRAPLMLSLNASAIYVGVAMGSAIGGAALAGGGWTAVAIAGGLVAIIGILHLLASDALAGRKL